MKKITSLLLMLLLVVTAANAKNTYWGYAGKAAVDLPYGSIGTRQGKAAIYIPAEVAQMYKGLKVTGISLTDKAETVKAFVAEDLNGAYATEKMADMGNKGLNSVLFDEAYTITGDPFYIGYEFTSDINVVGVTDEYCEGGNFTDFGSGWTDNTKQTPDNAPALALQMRVEGTEIPVDVAICGVKKVITAVGDTYQIKGKLLNFAAAKITSLRFGYTIGNSEEQFVVRAWHRGNLAEPHKVPRTVRSYGKALLQWHTYRVGVSVIYIQRRQWLPERFLRPSPYKQS